MMTEAILPGLCLFLTIILWHPSLATRDFEIRWREINCSVNDPATAEAFRCQIIELPKRQGNFLNTLLLLRRPVQKMWVELSVGQIGNRRDRLLQQLIKIRVDGCHLIKFRSKNRILNAVLRKLLQSGNYPDECPLLANVNYTSTHFALNPDHFPAYMPDMKFNTKLVFQLSKTITLIRASVDAEVMRRS
ncbi:uncharacterized protein Dana_GF10355 [Drosophila ananassae]|uniref:Uncharacterized protein n=2 Tax=Drosophila ananassae TaxID=7217 RepID=B3M9R5_DROAN|nr:uncharacterized protein LOC6493225 isoform X2 [Drosophila ananassae]EDV40106.1 uncharacterized protein Dana_GF10355 [Drosophila ananassae]